MSKLGKDLALVAALAATLVVPSAARGNSIVPPGNSAVNQYTQTIPTSGGNSEVRRKGIHSPSQALGKKASDELRQQGEDGQAAAELAAAGTPSDGGGGGAGSNSGGGGLGGSGGSTDSGRPGGSPLGGGSGSPGGGAVDLATADDGDSGVATVLGEMTGTSSSDDLGPLLPLALLATLLWCATYFWRRRRTA